MSDIEVLAGSVGAGGRNDGKDAKLVRRLLDDWRARETGELGGRPLPSDGPMEPDTLAAIRAFRAWSGLDPDGRVEPGDPTWDALAARHLAGVRSGRILPDDLAFVPLRRPGGVSPERKRARRNARGPVSSATRCIATRRFIPFPDRFRFLPGT